jgi:hypothetical protein
MAATKYDNALPEGRELIGGARNFRPTLFRDELIAAVAQAAAHRSILLVGAAGVT